MKTHKIEIVIDEKGDIMAETKGMQGKICVDELDKVLRGIAGEREAKNTPDYNKKQPAKQTVGRG